MRLFSIHDNMKIHIQLTLAGKILPQEKEFHTNCYDFSHILTVFLFDLMKKI